MQQRYDWTWDDAERTKLFVGLPGHARMDAGQQEAVGTRGDGLDHPAQKVIGAAVETLVQEIVTTLDFYRSSTADADGGPVAEPAGGGYQGLDDPSVPTATTRSTATPTSPTPPAPRRSPGCCWPAPPPASAGCASCSRTASTSASRCSTPTRTSARRARCAPPATCPSLAVSAGLCVGASR